MADKDKPQQYLKSAYMRSTLDKKTRPTCKYCQTDIRSQESACERCMKNLKEHGKPKICLYCKLESAFIGSKCQRCSSSLKKYGAPVKCGKCGAEAAFDHDKARVDGKVLCWCCFVSLQRSLQRMKRKQENQGNNPYEKVSRYSHDNTSDEQSEGTDQQEVWKQLLGEGKNAAKKQSKSEKSRADDDLRKRAYLNRQKQKKGREPLEARLASMKQTFSAPSSPSSTSPLIPAKKDEKPANEQHSPKSDGEMSSLRSYNKPRDGPSLSLFSPASDDSIVLVTKLRDDISSLKKQLAKKDQQLLDKDKQISLLKVEHITEVRSLQAKLQAHEEEKIKTVEMFRQKNQDLLKKIAQISKGKA